MNPFIVAVNDKSAGCTILGLYEESRVVFETRSNRTFQFANRIRWWIRPRASIIANMFANKSYRSSNIWLQPISIFYCYVCMYVCIISFPISLYFLSYLSWALNTSSQCLCRVTSNDGNALRDERPPQGFQWLGIGETISVEKMHEIDCNILGLT